MNRETILDEIRRATRPTPDGKIGLASFEKISGISQGISRGKYWTNWSQAVEEARRIGVLARIGGIRSRRSFGLDF
jgi:hypothetical protein